MLNKKSICVLSMVLAVSFYVYAHEGHHHQPHGTSDKKVDASLLEKENFNKINLSYKRNVKNIFDTKCMSCHSINVKYPFYYNWPIAHQIMISDVEEAKTHIGMDSGFPFSGHGTPMEDLEAIEKVTIEGTMPPFRYRIMHWGSALTESDKKTIIEWIKSSEIILKN